MMTITLLCKDYDHLATCLVPMGDQIGMSQQELADMLRTKTRRFSEEDIRRKYPKPKNTLQPKPDGCTSTSGEEELK